MKTRNYSVWLLCILFLAAVYGCSDGISIRGNGIVESQTRSAKPFKEVHSGGHFYVHITAGDDSKIVVEAESNLLPYINTDIRKGILEIEVDGIHILKNTEPINVYLMTPTLDAVMLSGSGEITTGYFESEYFEVVISGSGKIDTAVDADMADITISGSGEVDIYGNCKTLDMGISGSGKVKAYDFATYNTDIVISGSGNAYVNVENRLNVKISGSGNVYYIGDPRINQSVSGSGKVINDN